jgi:hypothetical protein
MLEETKPLPLFLLPFVVKDIHNIRKNGQIRVSIGVITHIMKSENVNKEATNLDFLI